MGARIPMQGQKRKRNPTQRHDDWVQCDDCDKWRRIGKKPRTKKWHCIKNPDIRYNNCEVPQQAEDEEEDSSSEDEEEDQLGLEVNPGDQAPGEEDSSSEDEEDPLGLEVNPGDEAWDAKDKENFEVPRANRIVKGSNLVACECVLKRLVRIIPEDNGEFAFTVKCREMVLYKEQDVHAAPIAGGAPEPSEAELEAAFEEQRANLAERRITHKAVPEWEQIMAASGTVKVSGKKLPTVCLMAPFPAVAHLHGPSSEDDTSDCSDTSDPGSDTSDPGSDDEFVRRTSIRHRQ